MRSTSKTRSLGLTLVVLLTATLAVVNLWSALTPTPIASNAWVSSLLPVPVRVGAHLFSALSGFFLLTLATNLGRRKRMAWRFTLAL